MGFMDSVKGFAEKVGDKVESGVKSVSDNSKKMAERSKIKREIAMLEGEVNNAYLAIGKKFVELNSENPGEDYAENVELIKSKSERAEKFKELLASLDDNQTCTGCGAVISKEQKFCDKCGTKVDLKEVPIIEGYNDAPVQTEEPAEVVDVEANPDEVTVPAGSFCEKCGAPLAEGQNFCEKCGAKVE